MRRPAMLAILGIVAGAMSVAACGGGEFDPVIPVYEAEVTGAVTLSLAGVSAYGTVRDGGLTGFTLVMDDTTTSNSILLQKPSTTKPVPGEYLIVPAADVGPLGLYRGRVRLIVDGALEEYEAQSGALIIAEATPTSLSGTFEFTAVRTSPCCDPAPVTIQVEGAYSALQGPVAAAR
jgi:hypothetical protein